MKRSLWILVVPAAVISMTQLVHAQRFATGGPYQSPAGVSPTAEMMRDVRIEQHLNAKLPLDLSFRDEANQDVHLGDMIHNRPVVLALVYYRCPLLCTQVLNGVLKSSQSLSLAVGTDFDVIAISIDPHETSELAGEKKRHYVRRYRRDGSEHGWHFLTGDQEAIETVSRIVGFHYRFDPATGQYAHASGIIVVTPNGRLSRYFYGIEFPPADLRLALVESSSGGIGTLADQVLLLCYHYDPLTGRYGLAISRALWIGGLLTITMLGVFLAMMIRKDMGRPRLSRDAIHEATP